MKPIWVLIIALTILLFLASVLVSTLLKLASSPAFWLVLIIGAVAYKTLN